MPSKLALLVVPIIGAALVPGRCRNYKETVIVRTTLAFLITAVVAAAPALGLDRSTSVTIYNDNLGLVRETRPVRLVRGVNTVPFADVAAAIDPTSVHLRTVPGGDDQRGGAARNAPEISVLEQNFRYDLVSPETLLQRYLGRSISVAAGQGDLVEGRLLSFSDGKLTLMLPDSSVRIVGSQYQGGEDLRLPSLPEGLVTKPTLEWLLDARGAGDSAIEVSYLTGQISWHAEYVGVLADDEKTLSYGGWVSIDNQSGATYADAGVKLVAGKVHRAEEDVAFLEGAGIRQKALSAPQFEEQTFFEYHMYTLGRTTTIRDRETKQVSLFQQATVKGEKAYSFEDQRRPWAGKGGQNVKVTLKFRNSKDDGLGLPLPAGKVRIYKRDKSGQAEFVGEDKIDHTPRDELVTLQIGDAFDIVGERAVIDSKRITDRVGEETVEITLRNHKEEDVTVLVVEHPLGDWEIRDKTLPYRKVDANTVEFSLPVPRDGKASIRYTVRRIG